MGRSDSLKILIAVGIMVLSGCQQIDKVTFAEYDIRGIQSSYGFIMKPSNESRESLIHKMCSCPYCVEFPIEIRLSCDGFGYIRTYENVSEFPLDDDCLNENCCFVKW